MLKKYSVIPLFFSISMVSSLALAGAPNEKDIMKGKHEYSIRCVQCHGDKGDGKGPLIEFLKIAPANLATLARSSDDHCVTGRVLRAVLGRHKLEKGDARMPLLKDDLSLEKVYLISEYIKSIQQ